jgi:hypothetical protein
MRSSRIHTDRHAQRRVADREMADNRIEAAQRPVVRERLSAGDVIRGGAGLLRYHEYVLGEGLEEPRLRIDKAADQRYQPTDA